MRIETALAKASLTRVERRDPYKVYHRDDARRALQALTAGLRLGRVLPAVGLTAEPVAQRDGARVLQAS